MASPKIQIKRNTYVPPYTLSSGELALNTASKNLFVQTGDGTLTGGFGSNLVVATTCVFTVQAVTQVGVGTGADLRSTFNIKTSGASVYDSGLLNIGTVLELQGPNADFYTSNFYVTDIVSRTYSGGVLNETVFSVRQVGTGTGSNLPTVNTILTSFKIGVNGMTWVGAQIDSSMPSSPSYTKLISQKGMAEYVSTLTAGTVTLSEMTSSQGTYYPIFASSTGNSLLRDYVTGGTVPSYDPSTQILSAIKFSGVHAGTGDFTSVSSSGQITSTVTTASGLAPFVVGSSVKVDNLNASSLSGQTFSSGGNAAFGTVSASGQITSTVAVGTAPLVVTSTTKVGNLNASFLDGATFAAPGSIGSGTPGTAAFTNLTTSGTTTINGNLLVNNTQTYLNTTVMQVTDKNIELGAATAVTSGDAYAASAGFTVSSTTLTGVQITGIGGQFSCTDTTGAATPQTLVVGQLVTISGTLGGTGGITTPAYSNPTTYKISATNGTTTFTLKTLADVAIVTSTGTPTGLTYTMGLRPYFATQGTPSIISSSLLTAKITFSNTGLIPVGIRIGSIISGGNVGGLNVSGIVNTVTSITPTEIFYTYTTGYAPTAAATTLLAVTNDYTATVTLTGSTNSDHSTSRMGVGSTFACTGFIAATATVTSITSNTVFTVSNRDAVVSSGTTAGNSLYADTGGLSVILIGGNSDSIADGGGFTVKGTTDKTLTWVIDSYRTVNTTKGYFSFNQPLQAYTSLGSANTNLSTLILTANNTNTLTPTNPVASVIEFETITAGVSTKGYFGMRNDRILSYSMSGPGDIIGSSVFSVTSTGAVGDCTIDCGAY